MPQITLPVSRQVLPRALGPAAQSTSSLANKSQNNPVPISLSLSLFIYIWLYKSRDSEVSTAIGYGLDDRRVGVRVPAESRIFSASFRPALGPTQSPIRWVPGTLSPWLNRPGHEADHSPTSAEVQPKIQYTSVTFSKR
jgi:hypothetical protein